MDDAGSRVVSLRNRCGESKSPYVRSHADNATAWQLWNPETLALAKRLNRVIFVSIGYSACHWCHVMAEESFADARVAQLLNERFLPVKLDREERPDIDRQYMDFLQATSGGGGGPLIVFLSPDLHPIFGGTYWPGPGSERARRAGGVSFEDVLLRVADAWRDQEARCRENGLQVVQQLREFAQEGNLGGRADGAEADGIELDVLEESYQYYRGRYDSKYGGFGGAPKFPTPVHLRHLIRLATYAPEVREIVGEEEVLHAQQMAVHTLEGMARGGIKDQLGHGFARYSVTRDWSLPHFEKMLYDNAQLLPLYIDGYLATGSKLFRETAHDIAQYLTSSPMVSPLGGIHASEDADSLPGDADKQKREGAFYVWTYDEFTQVLTEDELAVCSRYWGVRRDGNVDVRFDAQGELEGQNTLSVQYAQPAALASELGVSEESVVAAVRKGRAKLLAYRDAHRPRPALDDKLVTAWNGLAISGLARAAAALGEPAYLDAASRAAACIQTHLLDPTSHTLLRVYREGPGDAPGFAADYAYVIAGLLDLYESGSFDSGLLRTAEALQETQLRLFWDDNTGAFFSTPADQPDILIRAKEAMDGAEPSTNAVSAANLFRLADLLSHQPFATKARATLAAFEVELAQHPGLFSGLMPAVVAARLGLCGLMVAGDGPIARAALERFHRSLTPRFTLLRIGAGVQDDWIRGRNELLRDLDPAAETVQVCERGACRVLKSVEEVEALFADLR